MATENKDVLTSITIAGLTIDKYLVSYDVNIEEQFANTPNHTTISGKQIRKFVGDKRIISVNFEPMETSQINELFTAIKSSREAIPIGYIDPQLGSTSKTFTCPNLPSATYFVSDDGRQFWTIPTVNFEETEDSYEAGDGG